MFLIPKMTQPVNLIIVLPVTLKIHHPFSLILSLSLSSNHKNHSFHLFQPHRLSPMHSLRTHMTSYNKNMTPCRLSIFSDDGTTCPQVLGLSSLVSVSVSVCLCLGFSYRAPFPWSLFSRLFFF